MTTPTTTLTPRTPSRAVRVAGLASILLSAVGIAAFSGSPPLLTFCGVAVVYGVMIAVFEPARRRAYVAFDPHGVRSRSLFGRRARVTDRGRVARAVILTTTQTPGGRPGTRPAD